MWFISASDVWNSRLYIHVFNESGCNLHWLVVSEGGSVACICSDTGIFLSVHIVNDVFAVTLVFFFLSVYIVNDML